MKKLIVAALLISFVSLAATVHREIKHVAWVFKKSVIVGTESSNAAADSGAWLQVGGDTSTKGFIPPRVADTTTGAVPYKSPGMLVYRYGNKTFYFWNGTKWVGLDEYD